MKLILDFPDSLPDSLHLTKDEFREEATLAMLLKLYELKKISSGLASKMLDISRIEFLIMLKNYKIPVMDIDKEELESDILNA